MMGMDQLNLYQLRILAAVVEHGSFGKAAQALHLTQPAISAQVRHLRAMAGAPVFVRDGRRVVLTEAGRALYRYAQQMLGAAEVLQRDLTEIGYGERDRIVIGGSLAYANYALPSMLATFLRAHPNVWISVIDGSSDDMVERVRSGSLDAAVVSSSRVPKHLTEELTVGHLGSDDLVVIEAPDAPFSGGHAGPVPLRRVAEIPFVRIADRRSVATTLNPLLASAGLEPPVTVMELATWEGVKEAVRLGLGAAVVFRSVARRELERGDLRVMAVESFALNREIALICSPLRRADRMTVVFAELLAHIQNESAAAPTVVDSMGSIPIS